MACVCVCLSVICRGYIETAERIDGFGHGSFLSLILKLQKENSGYFQKSKGTSLLDLSKPPGYGLDLNKYTSMSELLSRAFELMLCKSLVYF